ncbi:MAG: hypothetical protein AAGD32_06645 [Planctomycetota bacterium]
MAKLTRRQKRRVVRAFNALMLEEYRELRDRMSKPVQRLGDRVIRSVEGEEPRREDGQLLRGTTIELGTDARGMPTATFRVSRPPAEPDDDPLAAIRLEFEMNRPILRGVRQRLKQDGNRRLKQTIGVR